MDFSKLIKLLEHPSSGRIFAILGATLCAHLLVVCIRWALKKLLLTRVSKYSKLQTLVHFASSLFVFIIYFAAIGFIFNELGISLHAYIASATVVGFALSFGSQGVIQDVITSITVITSDLLDIGDMVDIGGQVGIVKSIGMRFTVIGNFTGGEVYIPNRNVATVINYPRGYVRAFSDVPLPTSTTPENMPKLAEEHIKSLVKSCYRQFQGLMLVEPEVYKLKRLEGEYPILRIKFRVWPGQTSIIENAIRQMIILEMKKMDPHYVDSLVVVHYRTVS